MTSIVEWNNSPDLPSLRIDRSLDFVHPALIRAYGYWQERRGSARMPARADLDPVEMRDFLPHVGLVDVVNRAGGRMDYTIRLAGSHVEAVFSSITGRSLSQFLEPEIEMRWRYVLDLAVAEAAPLRFASRVSHARKIWLQSETLLAPLADRRHGIHMLFGAFAAWPRNETPSASKRV